MGQYASKDYYTIGTGCTVQHEAASLCLDKVDFVLRDNSAQALETFSWEMVIEQMKTNTVMPFRDMFKNQDG